MVSTNSREYRSGSARVPRAGEGVLALADFSWRIIFRKIVLAGRQNQHARRVRYPEFCSQPQ
jgi:hypothetical protein